jgi:hypothetical protein
LVVGEVPLQLGSPKGGPPEAVSLRVFQNLERIHKNRNFHILNNSLYGNAGTYKNNALGFFSWGRSLKIKLK